MTPLHQHILALALVGSTTLALSIFIFVANPSRFLNRLFGLYMLSIAWWGLWELSTQFAPDAAAAAVLFRIEYLGVCFIPTLFFHSVSALVGRRTGRELAAYYALSGLFVCCTSILFLPSFSVRVGPLCYLRYWPTAGPLYCLVIIFFAAVVVRSHQILWQGAKAEQSSIRRAQLHSFFVACIFGYLGGFPEFSLKYGVRIPMLHPFGLYMVPVHVFVVTYAIVQFRLFDIHVVIRRSLVYSVLITMLTIGYFGFVHAIEGVFQHTLGYHSMGVGLLAFALMAIVFQPLKMGVQRLVDWLLFRAPQEDLMRRVERLEQETQQTEKLKAIATLAAGMAHEIKNPLSSIKTFAEYLPEKYDDPEFRVKFARIVRQEVQRMNGLLQQLLEFAKPTPPARRPMRLAPVIDETVEFLHGTFVQKQVQIVRAYSPHDCILGDPRQLKQVFLNVLLNSLDAMEPNGCITVTTVAEHGYLDVIVADTGRGIDPQDLTRVFEPFYTTKLSGTGLGLSVVHTIMREHGAAITIDSALGRGTTVHLRFPSASPQHSPTASSNGICDPSAASPVVAPAREGLAVG